MDNTQKPRLQRCMELNTQIKKLEMKTSTQDEERELKLLIAEFDKLGCIGITDPIPGSTS